MHAVQQPPRSFLLLADIAARKARDEAIRTAVTDPSAVKFITALLSRPLLRPLLELEYNGCTTYESALLLSSHELVRTTRFRCRSASFRGQEFEALELSHLGVEALFLEQEGFDGSRWMKMFQTGVEGYACIDHGAGVCISREHFETALDIPDPEMLERVVYLSNGARQISKGFRAEEFVDEACRREHSTWWTLDGKPRTSVEVADLTRL